MSFDQDFLPPEARAYLARTIPPPHPVLERLERETAAEGQPAIGRQTGSLLRALALGLGATRIAEVGTNVGYSGAWLALGLREGGRLDTIEFDATLAARAQRNLDEAAPRRAQVHVGAALDVLPRLKGGAYDLLFLDAAKAEYPAYLDHAARLLRPGGIVAADNLLWSGRVWDASAEDEDTRGIREYTRRIFGDPRFASTLVPVEDGLGVSVLLP
jgi:predicted O-methyltransferase YrrM